MTLFERYSEIIPDFSSFQESLTKPFPVHIRINSLKTGPDEVIGFLEKRGIHLERSHVDDKTLYSMRGLCSPGNLIEYFLGHIHPQALTSCLPAIALSPENGSFVLDMCAAPGGKTSHLAQLMNNTGLIVANELYNSRHVPMGHTLARLGVMNSVITGYQAQEFPLRQSFDYVLADVPCTGEGRFRQIKQGFVYRETGKRERSYELQKKIILRGFDLLKDDGSMIYSTCTYNPEENESVVNYLLESRNAVLLPLEIGLHYEPGITRWGDERYEKQLENCARFYPHRIDSVGFFMAAIGRRR
ncbi:MAG: RsmB/NOP family class I SAM-dependent RNA methyltransferase [Deltaproteobacteria bacterium]|nr:RsmB/NOP family class I SAM-dependent RNA methyltransferase [Deltaproteobacteria bacterium]